MPPKAAADRILGCLKCGMRVTGKESACPRCGKKFGKSSKFKCPFCGESVTGRSRKCPSCKAALLVIPEEAKAESVDKMVSEVPSDLAEVEPSHVEEDKRITCPNCSWLLDGSELKCPRCEIPLETVGQEAKPIVPIDSVSVEKSHREISDGERPHSRPCPLCGAIVPKSLQKCPLCNTSFVETKPQAEVVEPDAELSKGKLSEASALSPDKVEAQAVKPIRERKLKTAKVTSVRVLAQTSDRGRTNGLGHVNGLSKVNGTGAVNGRAFVNGTGISNGLGARQTESSSKRASFLTRWQFLAVLVAIVIVIPTFVFLSYSSHDNKLSIDGDFDDWDGATIFGTKIQSTAPTSNITEWAVATQSSDLFFYFRTQANMMSTPSAESYYLFVDSDGSNATGYLMESIGADYMLQLTGWDNTVNSTSISQYSSSSDRYNWSAWMSIGSLSCSTSSGRLEARATMPVTLEQSARFVLVSKDSADRGSVSYTAPLKGGVLIVRQEPSADVVADGIIPRSASAAMLKLTFTCEGEDGRVSQVSPSLDGAQPASQEPAFSLKKGEERKITVAVDASTATVGQLVSAEVFGSDIVSSFASVEIVGSGAYAYVGSPPAVVAIDGAFADWTGRLSVDQDPIPVTIPSVDVDEVGNVSTSISSFFYISVEGEICSGTFVPAVVAKPSGAGGGGAVVPTRRTAEDILSIYVDSDKSNSTGAVRELNSKQIGADQKIEVRGLFGLITSMKEFDYSSSYVNWVESTERVEAAKDAKRIEIGVSAASLGGSSDIDFIVETTSWKGRGDLAAFDPSSMRALTRTWVVDPSTASSDATSMSYQRKIFYDGYNYWSFYFDGADTVCKYSSDGGITWSSPTRAFTTSGVNKVSVWYDSLGSVVYAVGDIGIATRAVVVQRGVVDPAMQAITWSPADATLVVSLIDQGDKNTFISKDPSGFLWILSSNSTGINPTRHDLSAFRSSAADSVTSWVYMGNLIGGGNNVPNCRGSILPAGKGSDVYAIYAYGGNVASRKHTTSWSDENIIHFAWGNPGNTDNAPPSAVVDSKGVVHVVYGTSRKSGTISAPTIEYSHNVTDQTTFTIGLDLDPSLPSKAGDYYPTISLETSTRNLYVLWLQSDNTFVPRTVIARICVSGTWSEMTIQDQTIFTKQHLTSVYSISDKFELCWQWTQNTTAPIQVLFDAPLIPEFGDLTLPVIGFIVILAAYRQRSRSRNEPTG